MTLFSLIYDRFLKQVEDYEIDDIYKANPSDLELDLEGFLEIAIPYFRLSRVDLSYTLMVQGLFDDLLTSDSNAGDTVISGLTDTSGLIIGMTVTVKDDLLEEDVIITNVTSTTELEVTALVNNYTTANNAKIFRELPVTKSEGFFDNDLNYTEENILKAFMEFAWANQQVNDLLAFSRVLSEGDFKIKAAKGNMEARKANANRLLQEAERVMKNYSWSILGDRSGL